MLPSISREAARSASILFLRLSTWPLKIALVLTLMMGTAIVTASADRIFGLASSVAEAAFDQSVRSRHAARAADDNQRMRRLRNEKAELESRVTSLQEEVRDVTARNRTLAARNEDLTQQRERMADEEWRLRRQNAELREASQVEYRGNRVRLSDAVTHTLERLGERTKKSVARNIASMPGEALPFLGIGVVVAATGWELYDSCQNMRDLHELAAAYDPSMAVAANEVCGMSVMTAGELWEMILRSPEAVWASMRGIYGSLPDVDVTGRFARILSLMAEWFDDLL